MLYREPPRKRREPRHSARDKEKKEETGSTDENDLGREKRVEKESEEVGCPLDESLL